MQSSNDLPMEWIERIFMRLHGRFGNQFYDKFRTGQLSEFGEDLGILNAKHTWSNELAGIVAERIKSALLANYDYPPSCDEFKRNCVAPREYAPSFAQLPPPLTKEKNAEYSRVVVDFVAESIKSKNHQSWIEFWELKLKNPKLQSDIAIRYAKKALKNLGKEWKTA